MWIQWFDLIEIEYLKVLKQGKVVIGSSSVTTENDPSLNVGGLTRDFTSVHWSRKIKVELRSRGRDQKKSECKIRRYYDINKKVKIFIRF